MDRLPGRLPNTSSRLIAMALSLGISVENLKARLGCSDAELQAFRNASREPTWPQLDTLVNIVVEEQDKVIKKNREAIAAVRAKFQKP